MNAPGCSLQSWGVLKPYRCPCIEKTELLSEGAVSRIKSVLSQLRPQPCAARDCKTQTPDNALLTGVALTQCIPCTGCAALLPYRNCGVARTSVLTLTRGGVSTSGVDVSPSQGGFGVSFAGCARLTARPRYYLFQVTTAYATLYYSVSDTHWREYFQPVFVLNTGLYYRIPP